MNAEIIKITTAPRLRCSSCGATQAAACDCGVAYVPAGELAAKAVAENPSISARALAAQLGVNPSTIDRERVSTAANAAVETKTRVGRDGKERVLPTSRHQTGINPPPARIEEAKATAPQTDEEFERSFGPADADRAIVLIAERLDTGLFNPTAVVRMRLKEAMARASSDHREIIEQAARILSELLK